MVDNTYTSIEMDYYRQDDDSTLASGTESLKSTIVKSQKYIRLFYHQITKLFYKIFQNIFNKEDNPTPQKVNHYIEDYIWKAKTHKK